MKTTWKQYKLKATYTGSKLAPRKVMDQENWNHHRVSVTNTRTGKRTRFDFWVSQAHPELIKRYDLLNAFYCFLSDATAAEMELDEFGREFGYESVSECYKTYRACSNSLRKAKRVIDGDLSETLDELQEVAS